MILPAAAGAVRRLLGRPPDEIEPLVEWPDHGAYRVAVAGEFFVVKIDADGGRLTREIAGQLRAEAAGVPVPPIVAHDDDCFAMRFVAGTSLDKCSTEATWRAAGHVLRTVHGAKPQDDHLIGGGFGLAAETWPAFVRILVEDSLDRCVRDLAFDPESATRIRRAFDDDLPPLEHAPTVWSHGDLQPEHVLLDPGNNDVVAIIDWADHGRADPAWDLAVLALDDTRHLDALLDGYASYTHDEHGRVRTRLNLYRVLRWLAEALWFAERSHPGAATSLERAAAWRREDQ